MQNTANYKFKKPENTDLYNVQDFSDNMEAIDTALKALEDGNAKTLNGLTAEEFMLEELMKFDKIDDGADISSLRDGIYWYNGYKASTITGDTLPFTSAWGLWIKKSQWNGTDRTGGRQDVVIRCNDGTVFTRSGTDEWTSKTDADTVDGKHADAFLLRDGSVPMSGAFLFKGGYGRLNGDGNWISLQSWETNDVSLKNGRALQISNSKHSYGSIEKCLQLCDIVGGKETKYFVHHDGNSQKVVTSASAPSDTSALWVVPKS